MVLRKALDMKHISALLALILTLSVVSSPAQARKKKKPQTQKLSGVVQKCHDGDTCRVIVNGKNLKIRFFGIDTPELKQKYGKEAQAFTEGKIINRNVDLECEGTSYDRLTCTVFLDGQNVNREIVLNGWAYDSTKYSKGAYALDVETAKSQRLGMWKDANLVSPYCFRHKTAKPCKVRQSFMP